MGNPEDALVFVDEGRLKQEYEPMSEDEAGAIGQGGGQITESSEND